MSFIDQFLAAYQYSERHSCLVAADPRTVLNAVEAYRPDADPLFKVLIGLRELPMRLMRRQDQLREPFGLHNFTLLGKTDDALVYGLIGQFWRSDFGLRSVGDGEGFMSFNELGVAKLVLGFSTSPERNAQTRLVTETRVYCPDRGSRLKFLPYWLVIRPISGLIRRRILSSIKRESERSSVTKA
jgi:hypothetical protein